MINLITILTASFIITSIGPSAVAASKAAIVSVDPNNIANSNVLTDLKTDSNFSASYETTFPKKTELSTDVFGNQESDWQAVAVAPVYDFAQAFFYFYHPLCDEPKWTNKTTGESSFDIKYRISMAVSGSLDTYTQYYIDFVNCSSDLRFYKFKCSTNFSSIFKNSKYIAYEISEFEIVKSDGVGGSNSYNVGKRFSWTGDSSGNYTSAAQDIDTVSLKPKYDYFRIHGNNGFKTSDEKFPNVMVEGAETDAFGNTGTVPFRSWGYVASFTDVFYVVFPSKKTLGKLCGADISYNIKNQFWFYKVHPVSFATLLDQDNFKKIMADVQDLKYSPEDANDTWNQLKQKKVRLSTGDDSNWKGITELITNTPDKQSDWVNFWSDHATWCLGYADTYNLPTVQKLQPKDGFNFVKEISSTGLDHSDTNPYAISEETNTYLSSAFSSGDFVLNDYYILRFEMENANLISQYRWTDVDGFGHAQQEYQYALYYSAIYDADVLDLHYFKDGAFYTIGVSADSGDIIPGPEIPGITPTYSFNWRILLAVCSVIALIALIWFSVVTIGNAVGKGDKDK